MGREGTSFLSCRKGRDTVSFLEEGKGHRFFPIGREGTPFLSYRKGRDAVSFL